MDRRQFLKYSGSALTGLALAKSYPAFPAIAEQFESYVDEITGATVYRLTRDSGNHQIVYQTHPQWSQDQNYLLFNSNPDGKGYRPHVLSMLTGEARAILPEAPQTMALAHHSDKLYFLRDRKLCSMDMVQAYDGSGRESELASLPDNAESLEGLTGLAGGISVDAEERYVYLGVQYGEDTGGIVAIDLASRKSHRVLRTPFKVGHVQANPHISGRIMYCHETGGDAPQRMWTVDVNGMSHRPFFKESYDEWVTHEAWWGPDRAIFTIWPYDDAHRQLPHGIFWADYATGRAFQISNYPAWHTHGSPDRQWAMGDDFDRNIWLVQLSSGQRRRLTQGHAQGDAKPHPHASFTPDGRAILLNSGHFGKEDLLLAEIPEWESLPLA